MPSRESKKLDKQLFELQELIRMAENSAHEYDRSCGIRRLGKVLICEARIEFQEDYIYDTKYGWRFFYEND